MSEFDPFGISESDQAGDNTPAEKEEPQKPARKKPAEKAEPKASSGIAYGGRPVNIDLNSPNPSSPSWPQDNYDDMYCPDEEVDYTDLSALNRDINRTRSMVFRVKNRLQVARRAEVEASDRYRRALNMQMIGLSGGTVDKRKAVAELATEDLYTELLVAQTVVKDITNLSYTLSRELDTLKTLSDNLRKQMSIQ